MARGWPHILVPMNYIRMKLGTFAEDLNVLPTSHNRMKTLVYFMGNSSFKMSLEKLRYEIFKKYSISGQL